MTARKAVVKLSQYVAGSFLFLLLLGTSATRVVAKTKPASTPDDRLKVDVLLVVAHPDDETGVSGYLAQLLDQHKRIAVVYLTHGEAGHNNMGPERASALGMIREMEVRHALTGFGLDNVWFLGGRDLPSQNVLQSLSLWRHGMVLEEVVRAVRLTRPEVIITWLPGFFIGENHGDHQASGVLATEAFDSAGDPSVFPGQLATPVHINETLFEGLQPWQPKKIYYFSDASDGAQFSATGPSYETTGISSTRKIPYWRIAMNEFRFHLTQYRSYIEGLDRMDEGQLAKEWADPVQLIFGKSNVEGSVTGDVFEGITPTSLAFVHPVAAGESSESAIELGGPWGFYQVFRRTHGLEKIPQAAVPEIAIARGATLQIPLLLRNTSAAPGAMTLAVNAPQGWTVQSGPADYALAKGEQATPVVTLIAPQAEDKSIQEIACRAEVGGQSVGVVRLHVRLRTGGLPQ